jgi:glycosyltransferase involved in cell wall biosynthesis
VTGASAPAPNPRRIAYVVAEFVIEQSGVGRKVAEQIAAWLRAGVDARAFVLASHGGWSSEAPIRVMSEWRMPTGGIRRWAQRERALHRLAADVSAFAPDLVYMRYAPYSPSIARVMRRLPTVIEVNSDDVEEYGHGNHALAAFNTATRGRVFRASAGIVYPSHELASRARFARYERPHVVIANGIDLSRFERRPPPTNARPRAVFSVSQAAPWHGLDKVLRLAERLPDLDIDVVGSVTSGGAVAPPNVRFRGFLSGLAYDEVLAGADVGIGTLALHRKGMNEASPLKVREYLAAGLPTVVGYRDTDFPTAPEFMLQLPNAEDNVERHVDEIAAFIDAWRGHRIEGHLVRHLDRMEKERDRLRFVQQVAASDVVVD